MNFWGFMNFFSKFFSNLSSLYRFFVNLNSKLNSKCNDSLYLKMGLNRQPIKKSIKRSILDQKSISGSSKISAQASQISQILTKKLKVPTQKLFLKFKIYLHSYSHSYSKLLSSARSSFSSKVKAIQSSVSETRFIRFIRFINAQSEKNPTNLRRFSKREDGFSLIEAIIVISIVMTLSLSAMQMHKVYYEHRCKRKTHENMKIIVHALAYHYISTHRMPMAASMNIKKSDSKYGWASESIVCGYVPFKSIGISERQSCDGYGNKIIYIYSNNFGSRDFILQIKDKNDNVVISNGAKFNKNGLMFVLFSFGKDYKSFKNFYKSNAPKPNEKDKAKLGSEYDYTDHNIKAISRMVVNQASRSEDLYDIKNPKTIMIWFSVGVFSFLSGYNEKLSQVEISRRLSGYYDTPSRQSRYDAESDSN